LAHQRFHAKNNLKTVSYVHKYDSVFIVYESWYIVIVTDPLVKILCALKITRVFSDYFRLFGEVESNDCFWQMTLRGSYASISDNISYRQLPPSAIIQ
jgi:hypothetical protein